MPAHTLTVIARWIAAYRRRYDIRPWQRAATPRVQALLVLRWVLGSRHEWPLEMEHGAELTIITTIGPWRIDRTP